MEITICRAFIMVGERGTRMTKGIAKQFPISREKGEARARKLEQGLPVAAPVCKVLGKTLGTTWSWLYLVPDDTDVYAWVPVLRLHQNYRQTVLDRGGKVDDPASVPTIIL